MKFFLVFTLFVLISLGNSSLNDFLHYFKTHGKSQGDLPLYLGNFAPNSLETKMSIFNFFQEALNGLRDIYKNDISLQESSIRQFISPPTYHTTVLYIGGNETQIETEYYQKFVEDKKIDISGMTFIYVPNKIICMPIFLDPDELLIQNKFPHVTLSLDQWTAYMSNEVMVALASTEQSPLYKEYYNGDLKNQNIIFYKKFENVVIQKQKHTIYVAKIKQSFTFRGINKKCMNPSCSPEPQLPLYHGIFAEKSFYTRQQLYKFYSASFALLKQNFKNDKYLQSEFIEKFYEPFSWHVTQLYFGGDKKKFETKYYTSFSIGKKINIEGMTLVYVPGKIMCMPYFNDEKKILIENQFPHVTLMQDEWSAVMSNNIISALCKDQKSLLYEDYHSGNLQNPDVEFSKKFENVEVENFNTKQIEKVTVYISKVKKIDQLYLDGTCLSCQNDACSELINN